ncbi:PREDICTED: putative nuclear RNA export factor SDE5 isoform X2 [Lupinus angustifolius]|nr:PREDICTED: putative nuclear RNA export factor SDE5 isoform X2 [Lupinus angustifolius]
MFFIFIFYSLGRSKFSTLSLYVPTKSFCVSGSIITEMEVSSQTIVTCDEEKALKSLLDAFGSTFSLDEIATAYCKASRNADLAVEILYEMQGSSSTSETHSSNVHTRVEESSKSAYGSSFENSFQERKSIKSKARPVSVGTVSSMIGKDYVRSKPSTNETYVARKPLKLDANALPMAGIWREKTKPNIVKHNQLHQDMEDFLVNMLGDGFQLDRDMIREVLDSCGYDMAKSVERLLDPSVVALGKRAAVVDDSSGKFTDMKAQSELASSSERKALNSNYLRGDGNTDSNKGVELHQKQKQRDDLQKEVMTALFNSRDPLEESPKRIVKDVNKNSRYGIVFEPPADSMDEYKIDMNFSQQQNVDEAEDEEDYQKVRKAVKEYRVTMNEYYKAAVEAFAKGDQIKAEKLFEQGHFFERKAHEADEESSRMILQTRNSESQEMLLDLHDFGTKEAIRLLKRHLSSLSGIPSFEYLKVVLDANGEDSSKGSRRRLVLKLLEKESIKWVEGEIAGTILIPLASIDRKSLSFV